MPKTNEEIFEAVRSLDPQNSEHWTADGQPRLDAVENLLGSGVTRKQVTDAAPNFTQTVAQELAGAPEGGEPPVDEPPVEGAEAEAASQTDEIVTSNDGINEDDPLAEGPADLEAELDAAIAKQREQIDQIRQGLEKGRAALDEEEAELARMVDEKDRAFPPMSQAEAIKRFQQNELAKRVAAAQGSGASPLDRAMKAARKPRRAGQTG